MEAQTRRVGTVDAPPPRWIPGLDGLECATVRVPRHHDQPGPLLSLAVARLPAADPSQRIGSLFVNPGGPGGSGVDAVAPVAALLPAEVRARDDIVGFDRRGVGRSEGARCFGRMLPGLRLR